MSVRHDNLQAGWTIVLWNEFRRLQAELPQLAKLNPPNININPDLTQTLGRWDEDRHEISLSLKLIEEGTFDQVLAVFLHEVAHQIVSELYLVARAEHHGEAFKRACTMLKIPSEARTELHASFEYRHKLLQRVEKLMALGTSANPHEAESALIKARELALRHNIDLQQETQYDVRPIGPLFTRVPSYIWPICSIVCDFYFCQYICRSYRHENGTTYRILELYGDSDNLETGEYVFEFLLTQGEYLWQLHKRRHRLKGRRQHLSFLNGLYTGFRQKLEEQTRQLQDEKALVWLGDPKLDAFYRQRNPRVSTRSVRSTYQADTHEAGMAAGRKLKLRQGVKGNKSGPKLLK